MFVDEIDPCKRDNNQLQWLLIIGKQACKFSKCGNVSTLAASVGHGARTQVYDGCNISRAAKQWAHALRSIVGSRTGRDSLPRPSALPALRVAMDL